MTGPIIPDELWPEGAHLHTWDSNGLGNWLRPSYGAWHLWASDIPLPTGWDWRVPVMRHQPIPAIDLEQFRGRIADVLQAEFDLEAADPEDPRHDDGRDEALRIADRLLALIDGQANDNGVRVDRGVLQMAINVLRRAGKHEVADALAGGVIDGQAARHPDDIAVDESPTKGKGVAGE